MWKKREYAYIGDNIPEIDKEQYFEFIGNYQKSIFLSLLENNLLTPNQYKQCIEELERQGKGHFNE